MKATIKYYENNKLKSTERYNTMTNPYSDEELRLIVLPHAVKLIDQEVYRTLGKCNTASINEIVKEMINIVKFGVVTLEAPAEAKDTNVSELKSKKSKKA